MFISEKFSNVDIYAKLERMQWKGRHFSYSNVVTYLSEDNQVLASIEFENAKIKHVKFYEMR
jgi:hypothetical protein